MSGIQFIVPSARVETISQTDYSITKIIGPGSATKVSEIAGATEFFEGSRAARFYPIDLASVVTEVLPFRIRFTNIGIDSTYGPDNPAPIGIAVVGYNNYVI